MSICTICVLKKAMGQTTVAKLRLAAICVRWHHCHHTRNPRYPGHRFGAQGASEGLGSMAPAMQAGGPAVPGVGDGVGTGRRSQRLYVREGDVPGMSGLMCRRNSFSGGHGEPSATNGSSRSRCFPQRCSMSRACRSLFSNFSLFPRSGMLGTNAVYMRAAV
ncbi:hypothetical protein DL89DRAFT_181865 [Linderina pennispora]|uniref:Uncharacterized protein n=1 Tax=Linderina pennispora TaxID=61395 RepID=A0A1Y1W614_9FUNG|nr:uncharacterized protein DL89DRAFT_181865 [Linderina pennispora]ORX68666.1 hypothetical protein DL89DRAFT_181865 [Linderina pennispora]